MRAMTKYTTVVANPSEFVHGLRLAIKHALSGRPAPSCVLMRWDVSYATFNPEELRPKVYPLMNSLRVSPPCICSSDAERIARLLAQAEHPVIIAGAGIHRARAYRELRNLAELLEIPVATTYMGKGAIAETHDLALGPMGALGQKSASLMIKEADLLLAVGTCLAPEHTRWMAPDYIDPKRQKIIQVDIEPRNIGWTYPVEIGVTSDAKLALGLIAEAAGVLPASARKRGRREEILRDKAAAGYFGGEILRSEEVPIAPERVVKELNEVTTEEDLIVLDAGNNRLWMTHHFQAKREGQIIAAGGAAGIGYGIPASLAVQMIRPDRRVVCVSGDGGFLMHVYALEMAKQYELPVTYVVLNNSCLGNVLDFQAPERRIFSEYPPADFSAIARGFGLQGISVKKPAEIQPALRQALDAKAPVVVDITVAKRPHFSLAK